MKPRSAWPISLRIHHWALALIIVFNLFILEEGDPPHQYFGYFAVFLVLLRLFWGFYSKTQLSFSSFNFSFSELKKQIIRLLQRSPTAYEGHNPLASFVYLGMWLCILALGSTGWMMGLDAFWGDETLEEVHEIFSKILLSLTIMHLLGLGLDSFFHKRQTWKNMIISDKKYK